MNNKFMKLIINIVLCITLIFSSTMVSGTEITNNSENEPTKKILFVGNSLTSADESITDELKEIIKDTGENAEIDTMICFGKGFNEYADKNSKQGKRLRKILNNKKYDVIVFQEQPSALITAFNSETYPCFKVLKNLAIKNGATPIIYMTWRYNYTFKKKIKGVKYRFTPKQMLNIMTKNSLKLGLNYGTKVVTAGLTLEYSNKLNPKITMWRPNENKHQSYNSAYLVACLFYRELFKKSPTTINYSSDFSKKKANYLKQVADIDMTINKKKLVLKPSDQFKLKAKVISHAENNQYLPKKSTFTYESSNPKIATVNAKTGKVKGIKKGRAIIYVTSKQTGLVKACVVNVKNKIE